MSSLSSSQGAIRFGDFDVDTRSGELRKQGLRIKLQVQPFQVLQILLEHAGNVVTREELRKRIWPADTFVDFDQGLNNAVKKLRDALADDAENPSFIETISKRGYRFISLVEELGNGARTPLIAPSDDAGLTNGKITLAVLPFENLGPDPELDLSRPRLNRRVDDPTRRTRPRKAIGDSARIGNAIQGKRGIRGTDRPNTES